MYLLTLFLINLNLIVAAVVCIFANQEITNADYAQLALLWAIFLKLTLECDLNPAKSNT